MLCYEKEFMVIASDGDIEPSGVEVAKRQVNPTLRKQALNKHENLQNVPPNFQDVSQSTAFDLKIITHKICHSKLIKLTSLKLDIKGQERSKEYYLQSIETFLENCQDPGGNIIGSSYYRRLCWHFIVLFYFFLNSLYLVCWTR